MRAHGPSFLAIGNLAYGSVTLERKAGFHDDLTNQYSRSKSRRPHGLRRGSRPYGRAWFLQLAEQATPSSSEPPVVEDDRPIWEIFADAMKDVPREDLALLPKDGAAQIDHYLYGHPKT
jgi:hypothetical protein